MIPSMKAMVTITDPAYSNMYMYILHFPMAETNVTVNLLSSYLQGSYVFKVLTSLASRGVNLRIVQNPPSVEFPNTDSLYLAKNNLAQVQAINITRLMSAGIMHTKLWVVDQKHFFVGSANMDWRSLTQVCNNTNCNNY